MRLVRPAGVMCVVRTLIPQAAAVTPALRHRSSFKFNTEPDMSGQQTPHDDLAKMSLSNGNAKRAKVTGSDLEEFDAVFPTLLDDVTSVWPECKEIRDAMVWHKKMTAYNVPHGKKNRGLTVVHSYQHLTGAACRAEDLHRARVLGWCVEWTNVGLIAVNDAFYLETSIYIVLKKYFRGTPYYTSLLELFHDCTAQTVIGQTLDLITAPDDHLDFTAFTIERYEAIVRWKTAFYSFYLPVACAMYMAGISDEKSHSSAKTILLKMGEYFQIQDDFLDCFGDPAVTGKIGTDIEDNKCSWLVVQALARASDAQRRVLEENYAQNDEVKVAKVKDVFNELGIKQLYHDYEDRSFGELTDLIDSLHGNLPRDMFIAYRDKIYKRNK